MKKANSKQITKYKTMLNKLFDKWVECGYKDGIIELDTILKKNADLFGYESCTELSHNEIECLICETENIMLQFGLSYDKHEQIKIDEDATL